MIQDDSENTSDSPVPANNEDNNAQILKEQKMILHSTHPLEFEQNITQSNINSAQNQQKQLTMIQKAIIACMNLNEGMASENQILRFLRKHWQFIRKNANKEYRDPANIRLLHINFRTKKNGVLLFVETEKGNGIWECNTDVSGTGLKVRNSNSSSSLNSSNTEKPGRRGELDHLTGNYNDQELFEDRLIDLLKLSNDGLTLDELVEQSKPFIDAPGCLRDLVKYDPEQKGRRRVRAILAIKLHDEEIVKNEQTQKYYLKEKTKIQQPTYRYPIPTHKTNKNKSVGLPDCLKNFRISDLSSDELWKIVRKRHPQEAK